nr:PREDICTED: uncharacterized protein LOC105663618 [Megachile rotundata]
MNIGERQNHYKLMEAMIGNIGFTTFPLSFSCLRCTETLPRNTRIDTFESRNKWIEIEGFIEIVHWRVEAHLLFRLERTFAKFAESVCGIHRFERTQHFPRASVFIPARKRT